MAKEENQTIKCSVEDCKHCDCKNHICELKKVNICNCEGCGCKETTMCDSYKEK